MSKKNGKEPDGLRCNFSGLPYRWSREWRKTGMGIVRGQTLVQTKPREGLSDEETRQYQFEVNKAVLEIGEHLELQERLVCQVLAHVPREFLVDAAPEEIDWSNPESLDWLQDGAYQRLVQSIQQAKAKN